MTQREPRDPTAPWAQWTAASGSRRKRNWWVGRYLDGDGVTGQSLRDKAGRLRTFATLEAADRAAVKAGGVSICHR